jgi:hypothetical protein
VDATYRKKRGLIVNEVAPHPWPPRQGKRFFLLWVAGILVEATLTKLVTFSNQFAGIGSTPGGSQVFVVYLAVFLATGAWHAWLLFPRGWRLLGWALIPSLVYGFDFLITATPIRWAVFYQLLMLLVGSLQCLLLIGVRRRPWLWFLAVAGECLVSLAMNSLISFMGIGVFDRLASFLPGVSGIQVLSAVFSGAWLLANIGAAAVLAWWMPPLRVER